MSLIQIKKDADNLTNDTKKHGFNFKIKNNQVKIG